VLPVGELEARLAALWRETLASRASAWRTTSSTSAVTRCSSSACTGACASCARSPCLLTDLFRFPTIRSLARHLSADAAPHTLDEAAARGRRRRQATPLQRQEVVEG
jgi:hypothetical protein